MEFLVVSWNKNMLHLRKKKVKMERGRKEGKERGTEGRKEGRQESGSEECKDMRGMTIVLK